MVKKNTKKAIQSKFTLVISMLLLNVGSWPLPSGLEVKTTLVFAAEKVEIISCLIFFSKLTDLLFMYKGEYTFFWSKFVISF